MATEGQRRRRRAQRRRRGARGMTILPHPMPQRGLRSPTPLPGEVNSSRGRRRRGRNRGLLANLGNSFLPGLGGMVGQIGDNLIGGLVGNLLGGGKSSAPIATAGRTRANQIDMSREHGTEQLEIITVPAGTPPGTILLQYLIAAPTLGERLAKFAQLWTQTMFLGLQFRIVSSNPTIVNGNYTIAIDPDPAQNYTSGATLTGRLMALTMASQANAWADTAVTMKPNPTLLFNRFNVGGASDAEIRQYACGQFIFATTTTYDTDCEYTIHLDWDVLFKRPDTEILESELAPPTFLMTTVSHPYNAAAVAGTTYTFLCNTIVFNDANIPAGTYLPQGNVIITLRTTGNVALPVTLNTVVIDAFGVVTMTATGPGITPTASGLFGTQTPNPATILQTGLRKVQVGLAKMDSSFRNIKQHALWASTACENREKLRLQALEAKVRDKLELEGLEASLRAASLE